jgi:hypothetical protein
VKRAGRPWLAPPDAHTDIVGKREGRVVDAEQGGAGSLRRKLPRQRRHPPLLRRVKVILRGLRHDINVRGGKGVERQAVAAVGFGRGQKTRCCVRSLHGQKRPQQVLI